MNDSCTLENSKKLITISLHGLEAEVVPFLPIAILESTTLLALMGSNMARKHLIIDHKLYLFVTLCTVIIYMKVKCIRILL
jgi:hypothetical protein